MIKVRISIATIWGSNLNCAVVIWTSTTFEKNKGDQTSSHQKVLSAPFPDYLYACGNNHSHGEDAHWTPFQAAAVRYIRTKPTVRLKNILFFNRLCKPWDEATEKLVVFLAGIVSHYVADISWHGMKNTPFGYGFIQTLGEQNYKCHGELCDVAHTRYHYCFDCMVIDLIFFFWGLIQVLISISRHGFCTGIDMIILLFSQFHTGVATLSPIDDHDYQWGKA